MTDPKIRATDESGTVISDPSEVALHDLLADMNLSCRFVILDRLGSKPSGEYYMQAWLNDDFSYEVEYRDGGPDRHFGAHVPRQPEMVGPKPIAQLMLDWAHDRPGWRTALPWKPLAM